LIEGNLIADPEEKKVGSGTAKLCTFVVASERYFTKDGEREVEVSHFDIEVWNRTAELCLKNLAKGRGVRVVGRLREVKGKWWIVGESVEFKTKFDKKPSEV
jgi:single-strand DNA-binding protein